MICEKCGNEAQVILTSQNEQKNIVEKHLFCKDCMGSSADFKRHCERLKKREVSPFPSSSSCATILTVKELPPEQHGWGTVFLDPEMFSLLKVSPGDTVSIEGNRTTVARVHLADPAHWHRGIVGVDDLVRQNAGVQYGDKVTVQRRDTIPATRVVFAPLDTTLGEVDLLMEAALPSLQIIPLATYDVVPVYGIMPPCADPLWFKVTRIEPAEAVMVTESTKVEFEGSRYLSAPR
ncbi:MAG: hypothetical protein LUO82_03660 [Methanomicrobiales archaeon]|nr:hypothetical protein [Methanomicrobiales archaeon]